MASVRKAVITAAGAGTRQYPATITVQKELIPMVDTDGYTKPTLQIILEDALASGLEEFCVIANPLNAQPIRDHFRSLTKEQQNGHFRGKDWAFAISDKLMDIQTRLTVIVQEVQEGYGHAVYQACEWAGGEPFVLLLGDHVNLPGKTNGIHQIIAAYESAQAPVSSVMREPQDQIHRYGTAAGEPIAGSNPTQYIMKRLVEKPTADYARENLRTPGLGEDEYLCIYGLHCLTADIFDCLQYFIDNDIRHNGEIQFAAAQKLLSEQRKYVLAELDSEQFDMGIPRGLLETQIALALHSPYRDQILAFIEQESNTLR
ncbi:MAG: sugar phosphate nucleotidyltransferase [Capsulimonadaceae bacterium]